MFWSGSSPVVLGALAYYCHAAVNDLSESGWMPTDEELKKGFVIGECEVLPGKRALIRDGVEVHPEPKVFQVLMSLAKRDGDIVTRNELVDEVWDGRAVADDPINRAIAQLRKHLGDSRPFQYVDVMPKQGYMLKKKVELLQPDEPEVRADSGQSPLWKPAVTILSVVLLGVVVWLYEPQDNSQSIGVLPIENASGNPDDDYLAVGFTNELIQTLIRVDGVTVKSSRVAYENQSDIDVANLLGVNYVLRGTLIRDSDTIVVNGTLFDLDTEQLILSESVKGEVGRLFDLQSSFAKRIRGELFPKVTQQLITRRKSTGEAYDSYMRGLFALERRGDMGNFMDAINRLKTAIDLDPNFGPAYLLLGSAYALLPEYTDVDPQESYQQAIETVEDGIEADESINWPAQAIYGYVYHKDMLWNDSEQAYLKATRADFVDSNAFNWYSRMLASVGRLDAALEEAEKAQDIDPTSAIVNSRLALAHTWVGNAAEANEFFERSKEFGAGGLTHSLGHALYLWRENRQEEAMQVTVRGVELAGAKGDWIEPVFAALRDPANVPAALPAIDQAVNDGQLGAQVEVVLRTVFGDLDGAMKVARRLEEPGEVFEMDLLWIPELRSLREHPDFEDLMENLGITDYWRDNGCVFVDATVNCDPD